jgi:hypothetical protein
LQGKLDGATKQLETARTANAALKKKLSKAQTELQRVKTQLDARPTARTENAALKKKLSKAQTELQLVKTQLNARPPPTDLLTKKAFVAAAKKNREAMQKLFDKQGSSALNSKAPQDDQNNSSGSQPRLLTLYDQQLTHSQKELQELLRETAEDRRTEKRYAHELELAKCGVSPKKRPRLLTESDAKHPANPLANGAREVHSEENAILNRIDAGLSITLLSQMPAPRVEPVLQCIPSLANRMKVEVALRDAFKLRQSSYCIRSSNSSSSSGGGGGDAFFGGSGFGLGG